MAQKPLAVGTFIVNDELTAAEATIRSTLSGAVGFPQTRAQLAARYGRWPLVSGLQRRGNRLTLLTAFMESVASDRYTQRRDLLEALNPEQESPVKLWGADEIAPEGLLCAFGPWDVYPDDDGDWFIDSVLGSATAKIATGDPVNFQDGEQSRQKAIAIEEATTNIVVNPSLEAATTNWSALGSTCTRVTTEAKFGAYSYRVETDGAAPSEGGKYNQATNVTGGNTYAVGIWAKVPSGKSMQLRIDDGTDNTELAFAGTGDWQWVTEMHTVNAGETSVLPWVRTAGVQDIIFYLDGLQIEEKDYHTTYCDGSLGDGYSWSGTEHASTSARTINECNLDAEVALITTRDTMSFRVVLRAPMAYNGGLAAGDYYWMDCYSAKAISPRLGFKYDSAAHQWEIYINGANRLTVATTFSKGDWIDLVVTLDFTNNSYALYVDGSSVDTDTTSLNAPTIEEWNLGSRYNGGSIPNFWYAELAVWDRVLTAAEVLQLNTNGTSAGRARWLEVLCEAAEPLVIGQARTDKGIVSSLSVHNDVRWHGRDGDAVIGTAYASPWYLSVNVDSDDDVWPVLQFTPVSAKTAMEENYAYKRWAPIKWRTEDQATRYPTCLTFDTATPIGGAKMQADGDDLRVFSDGVEIWRWFVAGGGAGQINNAATNVWIELDYAADVPMTLGTAIAGAGAITEIDVKEDITNLPASGIVLIGTEAFTYTGKTTADQQLTGVTRTTKGTSIAGHAVDDDVEWIQHDVWIVYGDAAATAPTGGTDYEPVFEKDVSSNTSWVFQEFGVDYGQRGGNWVQMTTYGSPTFYTDNRTASVDPWTEVGIQTDDLSDVGYFFLENVCRITNMNYTNGEKRCSTVAYFLGVLTSWTGVGWNTEYTIPVPAVDDTWEAWTRNEAIGNYTKSGIYLHGGSFGATSEVEAADCTVTLHGDTTPSTAVNAEQSNYALALTVENVTTSDELVLAYQMATTETLELDTSGKTVRDLTDGSRQMQALTLNGGARREWLRFVDGVNVLKLTDGGTNELEIAVFWDRRYWE